MRLSRHAIWRAGLAWCLSLRIAAATDLPGFSIEPPTGDAWHLVQRNASSLVWMRRVPGAESTFGTAVLTQALAASFDAPEAFLAWVRRSKEENPQPDRFRLVRSELVPASDVAPFCVRYEVVIEDRGTEPALTAVELQVAGLACLHPEAPDRYYDVQYSFRAAAGVPLPSSLAAEGRRFVDSLRFGPAPPDGRWALGQHAPARLERDST